MCSCVHKIFLSGQGLQEDILRIVAPEVFCLTFFFFFFFYEQSRFLLPGMDPPSSHYHLERVGMTKLFLKALLPDVLKITTTCLASYGYSTS